EHWWLACEDVYLRPPHWFHRLLQSRSTLEQTEHGDGRALRLSGAGETSAGNDRARPQPQCVSRRARWQAPHLGAARVAALSIAPKPTRRSHASASLFHLYLAPQHSDRVGAGSADEGGNRE